MRRRAVTCSSSRSASTSANCCKLFAATQIHVPTHITDGIMNKWTLTFLKLYSGRQCLSTLRHTYTPSKPLTTGYPCIAALLLLLMLLPLLLFLHCLAGGQHAPTPSWAPMDAALLCGQALRRSSRQHLQPTPTQRATSGCQTYWSSWFCAGADCSAVLASLMHQ
jgi:hypothetical protein